jgi:hypothetical protein
MGEIKSTYDIVMEKARGITVSEEEKREFQIREIKGRVKGWLQKYLDGVLDTERIREELECLDRVRREMAETLLKKECTDRLDLQGDNSPILEFLDKVLLIETRNIRETLSLYLGELAMKKADYEEKILNKMKKRGISGPAIVPNLAADQEWTSTLSHKEEEFRGQVTGML